VELEYPEFDLYFSTINMAGEHDWESRSFVILGTGFLLVMFGIAGAGRDLAGAGGAVEALEISGFICYMVCFVLVGLVKFGDFADDKGSPSEEIVYAYITAAFVSVLLIIIGLGIYGCKSNQKPTPYATAMLVCGALLATLGGSFGVLDIMGL